MTMDNDTIIASQVNHLLLSAGGLSSIDEETTGRMMISRKKLRSILKLAEERRLLSRTDYTDEEKVRTVIQKYYLASTSCL
jgi:hypothetical protein